MFQDPESQLVMDRVEDDVAFGLENMGWPEERMRPAVRRAIDQAGLTGLERRDGVPDIVAGYRGAKDGAISIHRGDADAIFPNTPEAVAHRAQLHATSNQPPSTDDIPSPFFVQSRVFDTLGAPQFIVAGDFDADGHQDVVSTEAGSNALTLLSGDGHGEFALARRVALPGHVTAMVAGDVNRIDGLADLIVAVNGAGGPKLLVYESGAGAVLAAPETISLPSESKSIAIGQLDDDFPVDIAVAAGRELLIVHGRNRSHSTIEGNRLDAQPPGVTRLAVASQIAALAVGDFTGDFRHEIALLSNDGMCRVFSRNKAGWRKASAVALPAAQKAQLLPPCSRFLLRAFQARRKMICCF